MSAHPPAADSARCPLCRSPRLRERAQAHGRRFLDCARCRLVHVPPTQRPTPDAERAHYGSHQNDPEDAGYRAFLDRLAVPLARRLEPGAEGLDYGSGPGPTLSVMLQERGFSMRIYDPFFAPDPAALRRDYHFVTCSETAEHFHAPRAEFRRLDRLLRPGGWLGVMTEMPGEEIDFGRWRYARDPTHVCFYRPGTMRWIADWRGWTLELPQPNVSLFRKPARAEDARAGLAPRRG